MGGVPAARGVGLAALGEPLGAVLPDRLEHPVPDGARPAARRPAATCRPAWSSTSSDVGRRGLGVGADRRGASSGERPGEHREPCGETRARVVEQVPAPLDDGAQRLVPRQRRAAAAGEQPEPVVQPGRDLRRPAGCAAGRRPARWPAAARRAGGRSRRPAAAVPSSTTNPGRTARRPVGEQPDGGVASGPLRRRRRPAGRASGGRGQSGSPVMPSGSRLVASTRRPGQAPSSSVGQLGGGGDRCSQLSRTMQHRGAGQRVDQPVQRLGRLGDAPRSPAGRAAGARAGRAREHRLGQVQRLVHRRELHQPDAARQVAREPRGRPPGPAGSCPPRRGRPG